MQATSLILRCEKKWLVYSVPICVPACTATSNYYNTHIGDIQNNMGMIK